MRTLEAGEPPRWPPCATIAIAANGTEEAPLLRTAHGDIRSRSGAELQYTTRDAQMVFREWTKKDDRVPGEFHRLLIDPRLDQVECAIKEVSRLIDQHYEEGIELHMYFAGHDEPGTGNLVLQDGVLSPTRFLELQAEEVEAHGHYGARTVGVMLDSCYSGAFLIRLAIDAYERFTGFRIDGSRVSCPPDEECYELGVLGHGVFTFAMLHPGNSSVDRRGFNEAILLNDKAQIAKGMQGLLQGMSSATAYLTEGRQFSLSITKHFLSVDGGFAETELEEKSDFDRVVCELTSFKGARPAGE